MSLEFVLLIGLDVSARLYRSRFNETVILVSLLVGNPFEVINNIAAL